MTAGGHGDDGTPGTPRAPAETPGKVVVRSSDHGAGDSTVMGAADTAIALKASLDEEPRHTDPDIEPPDEEQDLLVGTTLLGRYQITRKIGQGGMGAVYEATHSLIGKRVAVKVLLDKYAKKDQIVARLEQEARLASSIGHEHIIDITDFGQTSDGRTFVVMEFLEGESLAECLAREGKLPEPRILLIAHQVASALGAAHAKGVVHRDVKPENVFLLRRKDRDFAKVVDFGISKSLRQTGEGPESPRLTQTGMVLGTPLYMSPEQARGDDDLDHRIDIYALGVIMYELATGRVPFSGSNYLSVISQVLNDDPVRPRQIRPELSEEFEAVILKALEKERARRYQSTEELLADLNMLLEDPLRSTQRPRIVAPRRKIKGYDLRILLWIVGIAVVIAAVAFTVKTMMDEAPAAAPAGAADAAVRVVAADAAVVAAPDAAPAAKVVELWVQSQPGKAQIFDAKGRYLGNAPLAVSVSARSSFRAELDGYPAVEFELDPEKDAAATSKKSAFVVKFPLERRKTGGGRPSPPRIDAGTPAVQRPGTCRDGIKPDPITGKCPE